MPRLQLPADWSRESGYRLNADGKTIKYVRADGALHLTVEGSVNEADDPATFEYIVGLFTADKVLVEYPETVSTTEQAFDHAERLMHEYSTATASP